MGAKGSGGTFTWVNRQSCCGHYWNPGEPNGDGNDCVHVWDSTTAKGLNDVPCDDPIGYICEGHLIFPFVHRPWFNDIFVLLKYILLLLCFSCYIFLFPLFVVVAFCIISINGIINIYKKETIIWLFVRDIIIYKHIIPDLHT